MKAVLALVAAGILAINVIGLSAMGLVAGWFLQGARFTEVRLLLTTGILGPANILSILT